MQDSVSPLKRFPPELSPFFLSTLINLPDIIVVIIAQDKSKESAPLWKISLFGKLQAQGAGRTVSQFGSRKAESLLGYLSYSLQPLQREILLDQFWPDFDVSAGRNNLNVSLSRLRSCLEPAGVPPQSVVISNRLTIGLNLKTVTTDVREFGAALGLGARAHSPGERIAALQSATALYTADLMTGYDENWIRPAAQYLEKRFFEAIRQLMDDCESIGETERAIEYAHRGLVIDPVREELHQRVMGLYLELGQPTLVLEQFDYLRRSLDKRMGVQPEEASYQLMKLARRARSKRAGILAGNSVKPAKDEQATPEDDSVKEGITPEAPRFGARGSHLPVYWTRFYGRTAERETLQRLTEDPALRLITLTGLGGIGKTRLAREVGQHLVENQGAEVWFVPLSGVSEVRFLAQAILGVLPLEAPGAVSPQQVIDYFRDHVTLGQPAFLILDTFEHLAAEGTAFLRELLDGAPHLRLLVTSRSVISLPQAREFQVSPLETPRGQSVEALAQNASVQLFVDRAQTAHPQFKLSGHNAVAVATLCRELEGVPLALELAAARVPVLSPSQMVRKLKDRFHLLRTKTGHVTLAEKRHRSLQATLEWSYALLPPASQLFLRQLSAFHGSWNEQAALAVTGETSALESIEQLIRSSWIVKEQGESARFRLLDSVREFSRNQLEEAEAATLSQNHCRFYLELAEKAEPHLLTAEQGHWMAALTTEQDNLRTALHWAIDRDALSALRLAGALWRFWDYKGAYLEGSDWVKSALKAGAISEEDGPAWKQARMILLAGGAVLTWQGGDQTLARAYVDAGLKLTEGETSASVQMLSALIQFARIEMGQGHFEAGHRMLVPTLELARQDRIVPILHDGLMIIAAIMACLEDWDLAEAYGREGLELANQENEKRFAGFQRQTLAMVAGSRGQFDLMFKEYERSVQLLEEVGDEWGRARGFWGLASAAHSQGDYPSAHSWARQALFEMNRMNNVWGLTWIFEVMGYTNIEEERFERGALLLAAGASLRQLVGHHVAPAAYQKHPEYLARARAGLGDDFERVWDAGWRLSQEEAVTLGMSVAGM